MKAGEIEAFLRAIPVRDIHIKTQFVTAACPFAYWNHGGRDEHPSFGVRITSDGLSSWNCMAGRCGLRGRGLSSLIYKLQELDGRPRPDLFQILRVFETPSSRSILDRVARLQNTSGWAARPGGAAPSGSVSDFLRPQEAEPPTPSNATPEALQGAIAMFFEPLPPKVFEAKVFRKRTIPAEDYARFGLLWHEETKRIALPVRRRDGSVAGITGRVLDETACPCGGAIISKRVAVGGKSKTRRVCSSCARGQGPRYLHTVGFKRDSNLFGLHLVPEGRPIGGLMEGHFDAIACSQVIPSVAAMGSFLSGEQVRILAQVFSGVVIFPDGDEAGEKIAQTYLGALRGHLPAVVAEAVEGLDPDELESDDRRARLLAGVASLTAP